ncbi:uncharacterized protein DMAD_08627 [Drosophila madeirensis]|uniref:Uncharacterized protein n=1 Tax=Drosophila madeirensis TaxID=30013 RepID=A0AAU9F4J2_DROMD
MPIYNLHSRARPYRPIESNRNLPEHQSFTPSYEKDATSMSRLMSWHYGHQWLEESKLFHQRNMPVKERRFIDPGTKGWLQKRMTATTRRAHHLDSNQKPRWG